jgi:hypothetical protein
MHYSTDCPDCGQTEHRYYSITGLVYEHKCTCRASVDLAKGLAWGLGLLVLIGLMGH